MKIGTPTPRRNAAGILVLAGSLALPGCFGDDNSGNDAAFADAQDDVAAATTGMAMQLDQEIAQAIPALLADGVSSPLRDQSVAWSDSEEVWTITVIETYSEPRVDGEVSVTQVVQFLENGVPVQYPDESTDEVRVTVQGTNEGNLHPLAATWNADFAFTVDRTWSAVRLSNGDIELDGSGTVGGSTQYHVGGDEYGRTTSLDWVTDAGYTAGNPCVHGTVVGSTARHHFTASFDGSGTASWEIVRDGTVVRTGSLTYTCTGPTA